MMSPIASLKRQYVTPGLLGTIRVYTVVVYSNRDVKLLHKNIHVHYNYCKQLNMQIYNWHNSFLSSPTVWQRYEYVWFINLSISNPYWFCSQFFHCYAVLECNQFILVTDNWNWFIEIWMPLFFKNFHNNDFRVKYLTSTYVFLKRKGMRKEIRNPK